MRTYNLSRRAAADLRLRRRGHWDRLKIGFIFELSVRFYAGCVDNDDDYDVMEMISEKFAILIDYSQRQQIKK